jgi:hypothetical protein
MMSTGEDVDATALRKRGWTISAIARHLGRDRKTVRDHLEGRRTPGVRRRAAPDPLERFVPYLRARFADDPHVWASALFDEVVPLGYLRSYPSFVRQVRAAELRPHCEACTGVTGRETIEIAHPAGEEIQWDWFERRQAPWGGTAYVLLGTLAYSGRTARRTGCGHGPAPSDRGDGQGPASSGRHRPPVAGGPHGCQRTSRSPHWRTSELPADGHKRFPRTDTGFPAGGHRARRLDQRRHPLAVDGVLEPDGLAGGLDDS